MVGYIEGHSNPERSSQARRLDGESRSEGCILHHPNSSPSPAVSEVHSRRALLLVHLPPIRPLLCPMAIHQGNETSDDSAEIMGNHDNSLHRQHTYSGKDKTGDKSTPGSVAVPPGSCGSGQVLPGPSTGVGIPWFIGGLTESSTQTFRREDETDPQ